MATMPAVTTVYDMSQFPAMDDVLKNAIGRESDFSGAGGGSRDHGWVCQSEIEIARISRAIKRLGLSVAVREVPIGDDAGIK